MPNPLTSGDHFDSGEAAALEAWFAQRVSDVVRGMPAGGRTTTAGEAKAKAKRAADEPEEKSELDKRISAKGRDVRGKQILGRKDLSEKVGTQVAAAQLGFVARTLGISLSRILKGGLILGLIILVKELGQKILGGAARRREDAIDALVEVRGTELIATALDGNKDLPGISLAYLKLSTSWRKVRGNLKSIHAGTASVLDGEGLEQAMLLARHAYWKERRIPPPQVRFRNQLERVRFDAQMDLGGEWFGGWGKVPEVIGG